MNARRFCVHVMPVALAGLGLSSNARAQSEAAASATEQKEAQAALADAHKLGKRGDFEGACVLFEKSAEQAASADALLNAGICREYYADLVGALMAFEQALAASQGKRRQQAAIQPRLDALRPRIPTVTIARPSRSDTTVEVDAQPVQQFDTPLRMNPGEHQLRVMAPGAQPHAAAFSLTAGQALTLRIPELAPLPPSTVPAPVLATPKAQSPADADAVSTEGGARGWRKPLVLGGLGLFVAGGAFSAWQFVAMAQARSRKHDLSDEYACNIDGRSAAQPSCDAGVRKRIDAIYNDDEEPARRRAWVGVAAGGVGAAVALIGYFALPEADSRSATRVQRHSPALHLQPGLALGPGGCAAQLSARW